ncbi:MAG TPA: class I SAM-dependent methyltransferase [Candidatus Moranbacteria bacterium]|nr:class I SAM-dependent methyltransferase [Candidatus Moranbacteria bacterium]HRY27611.1 class I SAM-dependent methyltransferase [Candidatus Moranbacteria bacterium]HSA07840.1 class I SAM-dependent methyltransferase [Candidatus Moranbacteria bacterium]
MEEDKKEFGKFIDPGSIIAQLGVEKDSKVADFGCGPGFFSVPFAKAVGEDGKVYALDVLPQALESVKSKMRNSAISNIVMIRANVEKENGSRLESALVDWVILKDVLFQNQKKEIVIAEANRVLKSGGKVLVVEWNKEESSVGPENDLRISSDMLKKMFTDQNFSIEKDIVAGDFHYAFVATKK